MQSSVTVCFLLLVFPVNAHVVENFEGCKKYFYNGHVPKWTPNNHVHICQKFKNSYHFATLYDTTNRIPVYSAYIVEDGKKSDHRWMVEPQLVKQEFEEEMMTQDSLIYKHPTLNLDEIGTRQATDEDYNKLPNGYSRGHLNPNSHHAGDASKATMTLTNIVPQKQSLNEKKWSQHEAELKALAKGNSVYVLVGAIPSEGNWIKRDNQPGVNIPDYMWVAHCYCDKTSCKSGGATAKNFENKIYECTLSQLQAFLEKHNQAAGQLFDNNCYVEQAAGATAAAGNPCDI
ncbi:endonuclease domain-containing 1 protein-like [Pelmatolapia mariae]|uniref:endonuclease domain-containing 1 protein-like n=1 Tax=Pelmatolapia mariae TaxID=158779 RepID=UPI002FE51DA6